MTGLTVTATDVGIDVDIVISSHTRVYGDGTSVAVTGSTLSSQPYSTIIFIYYDQASRAGGSVSYTTTTNINDVAQLGDRHSVASIETPAPAGPPGNGNPVKPPGASFGDI